MFGDDRRLEDGLEEFILRDMVIDLNGGRDIVKVQWVLRGRVISARKRELVRNREGEESEDGKMDTIRYQSCQGRRYKA
jgi:hypothetical protein